MFWSSYKQATRQANKWLLLNKNKNNGNHVLNGNGEKRGIMSQRLSEV